MPSIEPFFDERTSTLTYVVFDDASKEAAIIDPVLDYEPASGKLWTESVERVARFIDEHQLRPVWILETHAHADHLSGSQWLKRRYGAPIAVSRRITEVQAVFAPVFDLPGFEPNGRQFDKLLDHGEQLPLGAHTIEARATPGHTPACMSFVAGDAVFTGDALFLDDVGVGRCDFPSGSADSLYDSVTRRGCSSVTTTLRRGARGARRPPSARRRPPTRSSRRRTRAKTSSPGAPRATAR